MEMAEAGGAGSRLLHSPTVSSVGISALAGWREYSSLSLSEMVSFLGGCWCSTYWGGYLIAGISGATVLDFEMRIFGGRYPCSSSFHHFEWSRWLTGLIPPPLV